MSVDDLRELREEAIATRQFPRSLEAYLPPCSLPDCPQAGRTHKHILPHQGEFILAPEKYLGILGGYGCVGAETLIEGVPVPEWSGGPIETLEGPAFASSAHRKGRAALYRVTTHRGREVVVTRGHRFLTPLGWRCLDQLAAGDVIGASGSADDPPSAGTLRDSWDRYSTGARPRDGRSPHDAAPAPDSTWRSSPPSTSSRDTCHVLHAIPGSDRDGRLQLLVAAVVHRSGPAPSELSRRTGRSPGQSLVSWTPPDMAGRLGASGSRPAATADEYPGTVPVHDMAVSSYPPSVLAWEFIVNVQFVRDGDFYDLSVPGPEHYLAHGIWHHNSGKTLTGAVLGVLLSTKVHHNSGFVGRRTYSKLHDSTLPIYLEVLQRRGVDFEMKEVRDGYPHRIIIKNLGPNGKPIDSQIVFRETKDLGRWLGPEYGWFHIDEASEEPKSTFVGLQGRLRLNPARRYLKGFITSNPPHHTHWIAEVFGTTPGVTQRGDSHYRLWRVASTANPFLPSGYVDDLKANHPASEVRRIIEGEYGFSFEGKAVYMPPFDFGRHVAELEPVKNVAVVRSWDFGYHNPVVLWNQFPVCAEKTVHWRVQHEYYGRDLECEPLADVVLEQSTTQFPDHPKAMFLDGGDRAGAQRSDKGPGPIIRLQKAPYEFRFRHRHLPNIDPGIALIRDALRRSCACGRPVLQIHRACRHTIDMLAGGYHYPQQQNGASHAPKDKPKKDGFYDNGADALRYGAENFYRGLQTDPDFLERLARDTGPRPIRPDMGGTGFGWLDQVTPMQGQALREERERVVAQGGV